jgi:hypothetical protein
MRFRVVIVVITIAVAVHALIFVALGRVAKGKGPLIPAIAPTAAAAAKPSNTAPSAPPALPQTSLPPESIKSAPTAQSRKPVKHARRSAAVAAQPAARDPVFDLNADSATTSEAP